MTLCAFITTTCTPTRCRRNQKFCEPSHACPRPLSDRHPRGPLGEAEVATWRSRQTIKRSYEADVLSVIRTFSPRYEIEQYGRLDYHPDKYPLFAVKSRSWRI